MVPKAPSSGSWANVPGMAETVSANERATPEPQETQSVGLDTGRGANTGTREPGSDKREKIQGNEASLKLADLKKELVQSHKSKRPTESERFLLNSAVKSLRAEMVRAKA